MTKEQLKSKVEELEKELAQFKKELDEKDKSPYCKRVQHGDYYFAVHGSGLVKHDCDLNLEFNIGHYETANYFSDESFAKKVAAEQTLTNLLRKYTYEHGWSDALWDDGDKAKYCIVYDHGSEELTTTNWYDYGFLNTVYFNSCDTAQNAIQEVVIPFVKEHSELGYKLQD